MNPSVDLFAMRRLQLAVNAQRILSQSETEVAQSQDELAFAAQALSVAKKRLSEVRRKKRDTRLAEGEVDCATYAHNTAQRVVDIVARRHEDVKLSLKYGEYKDANHRLELLRIFGAPQVAEEQ